MLLLLILCERYVVFQKKLSYSQTANNDWLDKEGGKLRNEITKEMVIELLMDPNEFIPTSQMNFILV